MAIFELRKTDGGQFNFSLKNAEGKTLLKSEQYQSKASAQKGIESVRTNSSNENRFALATTDSGKFYFNLKSSNGQIIGTSVMYTSEVDRATAVACVQQEAGKASLQDDC